MKLRPARCERTIRIVLAVFALIGAGCVLPASVGAADAPIAFSVTPLRVTPAGASYRLDVVAAGAPVSIVLARGVRRASLARNGAIIARAGWALTLGRAPFGHAVASFALDDVRRSDRFELVEDGSNAAPQIVLRAPVDRAYGSGLGGGFFFGILATIAIFQLVAGLRQREATMLWYAGWIASTMAIEMVRDGLWPVNDANRDPITIVVDLAINVFYVGFAATYLRLFSEARRLFWILVGFNVAAAAATVVVEVTGHLNGTVIAYRFVIGLGFLVTMAVVRRRAGFLPATYIALGELGLLAVFVAKIFRDATGVQSPLAEHWALEYGAIADFIIFSIGIIYRTRFTADNRRRLQAELDEANRVASIDLLTGVLNRRGIESLLSTAPRRGTILFVDLDHFKAVNDEGGHAAGDATLQYVAKILRHAVRSQDIVARFGGDEFVVFLDGCDQERVVSNIVDRISSAVGFLRPLGAASDTRIDVSIGSAFIDEAGSWSESLEAADAAAYLVKAAHKDFARSRRVRAGAAS